jgi:hypothetical protein
MRMGMEENDRASSMISGGSALLKVARAYLCSGSPTPVNHFRVTIFYRTSSIHLARRKVQPIPKFMVKRRDETRMWG